jgi:hypothetical protein
MHTGEQEGTFRERAVAAVRAALGEPEVFETSDGPIYRWTLRGDAGSAAEGRIVRLLVNSPEFPDVAHFNLSDNRSKNPLMCEVVRSLREVGDVLDRFADLR